MTPSHHKATTPDRRAARAIATGREALARGDATAAVAAFRTATALVPKEAAVWRALGEAYLKAKQFPECVAALQKACECAPADHRMEIALADAYYLGGAAAAALPHYLRAAELQPDSVVAWSNAGAIFHQLKQPEQAIGALHKALALDPRHAPALANSGLAFFDLGEFAMARDCLAMAVEVKPDYDSARWNRAILDFLHGDYARGWEGHELRHVQVARVGRMRSFPEPRWHGESFVGKRLLLWPEQGLGDQLQFVRFIPRVKALGGTVVLACAKPLEEMFRAQLTDVDEVVVVDNPYDVCDLQAPLMSLPFILGVGNELDAARIPYITAAGETPDVIAAAIPLGEKLRVGVVWAGQPKHQNDANRSIPLDVIASLFDDAQVEWFSVQKGEAAEQQLGEFNARRLSAGLSCVTPLGPLFDTFIDTAHAIARLDLLITVDTAVAHLAGAMNVPTWVLLPFAPDWRWQLHRDDTPWYPSLRLFRQENRGNWRDVISRVATNVAALPAHAVSKRSELHVG